MLVIKQLSRNFLDVMEAEISLLCSQKPTNCSCLRYMISVAFSHSLNPLYVLTNRTQFNDCLHAECLRSVVVMGSENSLQHRVWVNCVYRGLCLW